jgi:predicted dehydrogenase
MAERIKVGLIGCGAVSLYGVLPQLTQPDAKEQLDLVALCDVVAERARSAADTFGVPDAYGDVAELLARPDIDLVLVITPIPYHYPITMQALAAGKHVYVQKTMATTLAEAQEMIAAARARGLTLIAAPGQMLAPAMQTMKRLVADGALGKVYWAWGSTGGWSHEGEQNRRGGDILHSVDPSWYYRRGGGPLPDVTVYVLHSLTGILGPARRVTAMSGVGRPERIWQDKVIPVEIDDNTLLMLDFGNATFAVAGGHSCMTGKQVDWGSMGIYGSAGAIETLEIEPLSGHPSKLYIHTSAPHPAADLSSYGVDTPGGWLPYVNSEHAALPEPHIYADVLHCRDCIVEGRTPIASAEHAAHVVEIIEKGLIAARTGQTQELESTF